jgi:ribosomal protein S15P/S13E
MMQAQTPTTMPEAAPSLLEASPWRQPTRTREALAAKRFRAELIAHVGGAPSVTQAALIERIVQLQLHLAVMDRRFATTHTMSDHAGRQYLAWANSVARMLAQLGLQPAKSRARTLADYLAEKAAAPPASASPAPPPPPPACLPPPAAGEAEAD